MAARIRYMALGRLLLAPPGPRYHVWHVMDHRRSEWPSYPNGKRTGRERHQTRCGRLIYVNGEDGITHRELAGVRLDVARRLGRPCHRCFPTGEES